MRPAPLVLVLAIALAFALAILTAGCRAEVAELDGIYYDGDGRLVHCALNLDASAGVRFDEIDAALDRAAARGEVVELYAHRPGYTVSLDKLEHVLAGARDRDLPFVTYADFAAGGGAGAGIALSFDDAGVYAWIAARPLFQQYGARATFFVAHYDTFNPDDYDGVRQLAADGHEIAAHSMRHLRAPEYVEEHGLAAYLADEALPSIELLRADGYSVVSYAYPFGARTAELDRALAAHVTVLRSVAFPVDGPIGPCPR
jgi:peptidoglycan/xylan/chitin deacetylase (PgdA/CDA1 family)